MYFPLLIMVYCLKSMEGVPGRFQGFVLYSEKSSFNLLNTRLVERPRESRFCCKVLNICVHALPNPPPPFLQFKGNYGF